MFPDWIDGRVQLSDIILVGGGIWAFIKMHFGQQEFNRDILRIIGTKHPRDGILGDILGLQDTATKHHNAITRLKIRQGWEDRAHESGDDS